MFWCSYNQYNVGIIADVDADFSNIVLIIILTSLPSNVISTLIKYFLLQNSLLQLSLRNNNPTTARMNEKLTSYVCFVN